jgi:hypothetical protein
VDKIFNLVEHQGGQVQGVAAACSTISDNIESFSATMASFEDQMTNYPQLQQQYHQQLQQQLQQQHEDQIQRQLQLHQEFQQQQQQQLQSATLMLTTVACQTSPSPAKYNHSRAFKAATSDEDKQNPNQYLPQSRVYKSSQPQQNNKVPTPQGQQGDRQGLPQGTQHQQQALAGGSQGLIQGTLPFIVTSPSLPSKHDGRATGVKAAAAPTAAAAAGSHQGHDATKTSAGSM